jgi:hypothetical protein
LSRWDIGPLTCERGRLNDNFVSKKPGPVQPVQAEESLFGWIATLSLIEDAGKP